jgi:hypothetical protein
MTLDSASPRTISVKTALPSEQSFVAMPAGGPAIVGVIERKFTDAIVRETILATNARAAGQNSLMVTLYGSVGYASTSDNAQGEDSIQPEQIAKELGWYLTGIPMQRSSLYAQNKYGPFGYATGTAATGDRCLYAWQKIHRQHGPFAGEGTIGVRLRLCDAKAGFEQLLSVMYGFTITGYLPTSSWNPYGAPSPVPADLGALSAPKYPFGQFDQPAELREPPAQVRRRITAAGPPEPVPTAIVPEPPGGGGSGYAIVPGPPR